MNEDTTRDPGFTVARAGDLLNCGHPATAREPGSIASGIAYFGERTMCYECADAMKRAEMADPEKKKIVAYVSGGDGKTITTWSGGFLAHVTWHTTSRTGFNQSTIHHYNARDPRTGREWYGRNGGPGMAITLTARKGWQPEKKPAEPDREAIEREGWYQYTQNLPTEEK